MARSRAVMNASLTRHRLGLGLAALERRHPSSPSAGTGVWVPETVSAYAPWAYSWIRPPSRSLRTTRIPVTCAGRFARPAGGFCCACTSASSSAPRAARALYTHRNTILNRLQRAGRLLPLPLAGYGLEIGVALEIAHWLVPNPSVPPVPGDARTFR
jgi:hypothetical protein